MADATQAIFTVGMATAAVLVGILVNNSRLSDLRGYFGVRFAERFADMERVNEARTKLILSKIENVGTRLSRLEERFAR